MTADELKAALLVVLPEVIREALRKVLPEVLAQQQQPAANDPDCLLDLRKAANRLGLGKSTVRKLAARCELPSVSLGRRLLFRSTDLDAYADTHRRSPERVRAVVHRRG